MEKSQPHNTQDIKPLKDKTTEGLLKKVWNRLSDRSKLPRCLWFPPKRHLDLDADEWQRQHDEVSKSLRRTMITLLGYCFFCMLTLAAPDVSLIASDAKIKVPFAGTEVSYQSFLMIGPLTMFALVIYLHILLGHLLSLEKHKETFGLPYIFNIDSKTANWLANFIFYWLPCLVLAYFSWKTLPRPNESFLLIIQTAVIFSCMVLLKIRRFPDDQHRFKFNALFLFGWLLGIFLLLAPKIGFYERSLDLYRAKLSGKDLRTTYLFKANLVEANLNEANLSRVNLRGAILPRADLRKANLSEADLRGADLRGADLRKAVLPRADLQKADLMGANLSGVDLRGAFLSKAYLIRANLSGADLRGADLREADLTGANLRGANLRGIDMSRFVLSRFDVPREFGRRIIVLPGANLSGAVLFGVNLSGANLRGANLMGADLRGADLSGVDLLGAKELTLEQLCQASTLYEAKLDQELETQIKQKRPDLLKEPQKTNPDEKK